MNIIKYLVSKSYRYRFDTEYTKELCAKLASEEEQEQNAYEGILGKKVNA